MKKIVLIRSELCAALGISSSLVVPPPYLVNMIREGYPPGFVVKFRTAGSIVPLYVRVLGH